MTSIRPIPAAVTLLASWVLASFYLKKGPYLFIAFFIIAVLLILAMFQTKKALYYLFFTRPVIDMYWRTKFILGMNPLYVVGGIAPLYVIWYHVANSKKFLTVRGSGMIALFYLSSVLSFAAWYFKSPDSIYMSLVTIMKVISAFCLFFIIPHVFREVKDVRRFVIILTISVLAVYAVTGFQYVTGDFGVQGDVDDAFYIGSREGFTRMSGIYEGTYELAYYSFYVIVFSAFLFPWIRKKPILKLLMCGYMLIALYVLFRTYVRVAWAMMGFVPILYYAINRKVLKSMAVIVLVGILLLSSGPIRARFGDEVGFLHGDVEFSRIGTSRGSVWVKYWNEFQKGDVFDKVLGRRGLGNPENQFLYLLGYFGMLGTLVFHLMMIYISYLLYKSFIYFRKHPHELFTRYSQLAFLFFVSFFLFAGLGTQQLTIVGSQWVIFSIASISIYQWQSYKSLRERMIEALEVRMAKIGDGTEAAMVIEPGEEEFYREVREMLEDKGHMPGSEKEAVDFSRDESELACMVESPPAEAEASFKIAGEVLSGLVTTKKLSGRIFQKLGSVSDIAFNGIETEDAPHIVSADRFRAHRWAVPLLISGIILGGGSLYYYSSIGTSVIEREGKPPAGMVTAPAETRLPPPAEEPVSPIPPAVSEKASPRPREKAAEIEPISPSASEKPPPAAIAPEIEKPIAPAREKAVMKEPSPSSAVDKAALSTQTAASEKPVPPRLEKTTMAKPPPAASTASPPGKPEAIKAIALTEYPTVPKAWKAWTRQSLTGGVLLRATVGGAGEIMAAVRDEVSAGLIMKAEADAEWERRKALFDYGRYVYIYVRVRNPEDARSRDGHGLPVRVVLKDSAGNTIEPVPAPSVPHGEEIGLLATGPPDTGAAGGAPKAGMWAVFPLDRIHADTSFIQLVAYDVGSTSQRALVWRIGGGGG